MDTMTINKIIGALLLALLLAKASEMLAEIPFHTDAPETPAYAVALPETEQAQAEPEEPQGPSLAALLAQASADAGERAFRKCAACHTIEEGGANRVGPNLHNTVGASVAHVESFNYSDALANFEGEWTYERLDAWLTSPSGLIPGNRMAFAGVSDPEERADLIAYLRANTQSPPPLPEAADQASASATEAGQDGQKTSDSSPARAEQADAAEESGSEGASEVAQPESGAQTSPLAGALAQASLESGQKLFNRCAMCHTIAKGEPARVGPNLYGIVGEDIAKAEGYSYSSALAALEGEWTYERLDAWLKNPMQMVQGTKMAFPGLPELQDRADVIAYLRSHDDSPPPLPAAGE